VKYLHEREEGFYPDFVKPVDFVKCKGNEHLREYFDAITKKGGEGVMLRKSMSLYEGGRSEGLKKYKEFFDTEVKVLQNNYPHGFECLQYVIAI
jgi:ATP-dependent DNA ligase